MTRGTTPTVGFIGAGRMAQALAVALDASGYSVVAVSSRTPASAQRLAAAVPGVMVCAQAQGVADAASLVFITTPDDAIAAVDAAVAWQGGQVVAHCSGSLASGVLAHAQACGAAVASAHPITTAPGFGLPAAWFEGVGFGAEGDAAALRVLRELVSAIGGYLFEIAPERKALYHLAGVVACNHLVTLLAMAEDLMAAAGVDPQVAAPALRHIAGQTLANAARFGLPGALSGPVARGDLGTVQRHLAGLAEGAPDYLPLYREMVLATIPIGERKGTLTPEQAAALRDITTAADGPAAAGHLRSGG